MKEWLKPIPQCNRHRPIGDNPARQNFVKPPPLQPRQPQPGGEAVVFVHRLGQRLRRVRRLPVRHAGPAVKANRRASLPVAVTSRSLSGRTVLLRARAGCELRPSAQPCGHGACRRSVSVIGAPFKGLGLKQFGTAGAGLMLLVAAFDDAPDMALGEPVFTVQHGRMVGGVLGGDAVEIGAASRSRSSRRASAHGDRITQP